MDDNTDKKLFENATRVAGIGALRQIRKLVDSFEDQDRKNKQRAIALIIATLIFAVSFVYFVMHDESETIILNNNSNQSKISP